MPGLLNTHCIYCGCLIDVEIAPGYPVCIMCDSADHACERCNRSLESHEEGVCTMCREQAYERECAEDEQCQRLAASAMA